MKFRSLRVATVTGPTVALVAVALAVAGCTSSAPSGRTAELATESPQQRAVAEAAVILKAFVPPPGAREVPVSSVPVNAMSGTAAPLVTPDGDQAVKTSWWLVGGETGLVERWEAAHLPASFQLSTVSAHPVGPNAMKFGTWADTFYLPAVPRVFGERGLAVTTTVTSNGQPVIRVDAFADSIPVRSGGDVVPPTARVATLTEGSGPADGTPGGTTTQTVSLTNAAKVTELATDLNEMPLNEPGAPLICAADFVQSLTVTFRAEAGGPVLAQASGDPTGCGLFSYSMPGQASVGIGGPDGAGVLLYDIDQLTGLHWAAGPVPGPSYVPPSSGSGLLVR